MIVLTKTRSPVTRTTSTSTPSSTKPDSDFTSEAARELFVEWRKRSRAQEDNLLLLERKRDEYASADYEGKRELRDTILSLESSVEEEQEALVVMEREIRRLEQEEFINKMTK